MNRDDWVRRLEREEWALGFRDGYKCVYGPWATLRSGKIAFLSLKPGRAPDDFDRRTISDERGNSYAVEEWTTCSPITAQFLKFCRFMGYQPEDVLTGVVTPFRAHAWKDLTPEQQQASLETGRQFWRQPLMRDDLKQIFVCSSEAAKLVTEITDAVLDRQVSAAWGNTRLRRYRASSGKVIIQMPHLSRYKLFGRAASENAVRSLLT